MRHPILTVRLQLCADRVDASDDASTSAHVLRKGSELLAAGYALYGSATQLVLSCGHGVDGFTLHRALETFVLTRPRLALPPLGRFFSCDMGNSNDWSDEIADHVDRLASSKSLRYIGTFIADVHRTLLYGGIFLYPASKKLPMGKLRLLYEASPIAFLMEQAGGKCTTGTQRVLDVQPTSLMQCTPIAFGSPGDIDEFSQSIAFSGVAVAVDSRGH